jgi:hypothetical protein
VGALDNESAALAGMRLEATLGEASLSSRFQLLCLTLADETAPRKIALLKQRLRLMLLTEEKQS